MKIETSELIGPALDWAVECAKGTHWSPNGYFVFKTPDGKNRAFSSKPEGHYSTDWSQGGPIIERGVVSLGVEDGGWRALCWGKDGPNPELYSLRGPTTLVAAMRCYVASKMGNEVNIPDTF
jgi:hypothetical protein